MQRIKQAIISVSNKTGVVDLAKELVSLGITLISTGGTASVLKSEGIPVKDISEVTDFPEILDGRVKTLHPKVLGGILYIRDKHEHIIEKFGIASVDLVVVNLYPFVETINKPECTFEQAIENIDIGGPTMIRAGAKNHDHVGVVVDPKDYNAVVSELKNNNCSLTDQTKRELALKAFEHTSSYDLAIANYLKKVAGKEIDFFPDVLQLNLTKVRELRYGENPHQKAALYVNEKEGKGGLAEMLHMHGKELSYNNILDIEGAFLLVMEFDDMACAIIKHTNPCGIAIDNRSLLGAYKNALFCDPVSAFGGIAAFNRILTPDVAAEMSSHFFEVVIAPDFEEEARKILSKKKNLRLIQLNREAYEKASVLTLRSASGAVLAQERDKGILNIKTVRVVTKRQPTDDEYKGLSFAWKVCQYVKSNAIVFTNSQQTIGIGAGQMSRVDSVKLAVMKAKLSNKSESLKGTCVASDGFFPFRDGIDEAANAGATAVIQPGGSIRDEEVIKAADEHNMTMILTGMRHFRH